jgi:hypothetical protein
LASCQQAAYAAAFTRFAMVARLPLHYGLRAETNLTAIFGNRPNPAFLIRD